MSVPDPKERAASCLVRPQQGSPKVQLKTPSFLRKKRTIHLKQMKDGSCCNHRQDGVVCVSVCVWGGCLYVYVSVCLYVCEGQT